MKKKQFLITGNRNDKPVLMLIECCTVPESPYSTSEIPCSPLSNSLSAGLLREFTGYCFK